MDDEQIIELFFSRSELAISELDTKYGKVCYKLSYNILNDWQDAEECVNDAYLCTWDMIPPQRPNPLLTFVCKLVRNISISRHRANTAKKRSSTYSIALNEIEHCISSSVSIEEEIEANTLSSVIENFLDILPEESRVVFMRRYWFSDSYAEIAKLTGITEKNVSVKLTRIRKQLRNYLMERGVI